MDSNIMTKGKQMLSKVPEITIYFWVIKVLCTTVGETAADYLSVSLNFGLALTSIITGVLLAIALIFQFRSKKYVPGTYWLSVFFISIFGTLVTDNLTDALGVPLELSTAVFAVLLTATFAVWYSYEKTLSIHSIYTWRRESFYWLAILFTFALGTAAGDLLAESFGLGYLFTGMIVSAMILSVILAWKLKFDSILTFWIGYILTRPLGASIGDYLSQTPASGGLGLGPTMTSLLFVSAISLTVIYLTLTKKDQMVKRTASEHEKIERSERAHISWQITGMVLAILLIAGLGYFMHNDRQQNAAPVIVSSDAPLGDLSEFKKISEDTLSLVQEGKLAEAKTRVGDLEVAWDKSASRLKKMSRDDWSKVDTDIDDVLKQLRAAHQDAKSCESSLNSLIGLLDSLDKGA